MSIKKQTAKLRQRHACGTPVGQTALMPAHDRSLASSAGFMGAIVTGTAAWLEYADAHKARYESPIGEDYVLGPAWLEWAKALRTMLNGETGNLDCGTLDAAIMKALAENGFAEETF